MVQVSSAMVSTESPTTNQPEQIVSSNVTAIAAGDYYSLFIKSDGSLWAMGNNYEGQLGAGGAGKLTVPEEIVSNSVTAIAAGPAHSLFIKSDGSLWAMGDNNYGQLGDGTFNNTNQPEEIVSSNVTAIAVGGFYGDPTIEEFSLFTKSDGSLWAMGYENSGDLGDGNYFIWTNQPEQIVSNNVVAIAAGGSHSLFVKSDGSLWAMGQGFEGELGNGRTGITSRTNKPVQILSSGVIAVAAGGLYSLFLKSDGSLWAMGQDRYGELGDGFNSGLEIDEPFPEQIVPRPPPMLGQNILSQTNLEFYATCWFGGTFSLLTSTNLALPPGQWTPVLNTTNSVTASPLIEGNYAGTNYPNYVVTVPGAVNPNGGQQFFMLQGQ